MPTPMPGEEADHLSAGRKKSRGFMERAGESLSDTWGLLKEERSRAISSYSGIGPKGYRLSDEVLRDRAAEAMASDPELDPGEIELLAENGIITLRGTVSSRWMKRRAEDAIDGIFGLVDVRNELELRRAEEPAGTQQVSPTFGEIGLEGATTIGGYNNTIAVFPEEAEETGEDEKRPA
jgi:hypothetical protein